MNGDPPHRALLGGEGVAAFVDALVAEVGPDRTITGWGTIDLDRAADGPDAAVDPHLGARTRHIDDHRLALEPTTEGRLAASLARYGEGPVVLYLLGGRRPAGVATSTEADGPFGPQRLVLGGPRWGPHIVLVAPRGTD